MTKTNFTRRQFHAGLAGSAAVSSLVSAPAIAQRRGGECIMSQQSPPPSIDAQTTSAQHARNVSMHMYECLYTRDEGGNVIADLAEGVDISPDGLT
jgi:peptide/nickel transport system substrate-binding protein